MQTVTSTDGVEIAYERHGSGPPIVLLHGGLTRRYWEPVVPLFADDFTVVVSDRRGRGDSGDREEYSLDREVADASAVVDAAAAETGGEPVVFGHSFGGLQAIELARDSSVVAVVAYEPAVLVGEYREQADLAARMAAKLDRGDRREASKCHLREVLHGGDVTAAQFEAWLDDWPAWPECVRFVENVHRMNRAIEAYRLPATLDVDAPALLLTGSDGPRHLRESVRAVHEALPDSRLVEFDGVGHSGPTQAPERVADAIRDFLEHA